MVSIFGVISEASRFAEAAEMSSQEQVIEDAAYDFAVEVTKLEEVGDTTSATIKTFDANVVLTAMNKGKPRVFGVPYGLEYVLIEAIVKDEQHGEVRLTQFGTRSGLREGISFTRSSFRGERANKQVYSYLAQVFRMLAAEGYNSYVGARDSPPGVTLSWEDIGYYIGLTYRVTRGETAAQTMKRKLMGEDESAKGGK